MGGRGGKEGGREGGREGGGLVGGVVQRSLAPGRLAFSRCRLQHAICIGLPPVSPVMCAKREERGMRRGEKDRERGREREREGEEERERGRGRGEGGSWPCRLRGHLSAFILGRCADVLCGGVGLDRGKARKSVFCVPRYTGSNTGAPQ